MSLSAGSVASVIHALEESVLEGSFVLDLSQRFECLVRQNVHNDFSNTEHSCFCRLNCVSVLCLTPFTNVSVNARGAGWANLYGVLL